MIIIDSSKPYNHTDQDGTTIQMRYLTGRNRPAFMALMDKWKKVEKLSKSDEFVASDEMESLSKELVELFVVSIDNVKYDNIVSDFIDNQPVAILAQVVTEIFKALPALQGVRGDDLKN